VDNGECVALVGESGSGKSVTARTLLGLAGRGATVRADRLRIAGQDTGKYRQRDWQRVRGRTAGLVSQDALVSLDPLRRIEDEVLESVRARGVPAAERRQAVIDALAEVGVPDPEARAGQYPHQLSGGLRQRALIAAALAARPDLLIADEPTTALDVLVQQQILDLLGEIKRSGRALLLISHDLAVVASLADRIAVLRDGEIVESGPTRRVLGAPEHAYTRMLIDAARGRRASRPAVAVGEPLVEAQSVSRSFGARRAVAAASLTLRAGETLGVVGESGSGKSTLARMLMGLTTPDEGAVLLAGQPWSAASERSRRGRRRDIQLINQNPHAAFDPRFTVGQIIAEAVSRSPGSGRRVRRQRVAELLAWVGISTEHADRRPHQLSGGQRQRVAIARALAPRPRILVCDEPVSALDVSVRAQVLDLLARLQSETGVALVFISHDLGVVEQISDRLMIMKDGEVVEEGGTAEVFDHPQHPYTKALLAAVPRLSSDSGPDSADLGAEPADVGEIAEDGQPVGANRP
jgi:peptide/nickel transport system ATP-binding protein